MRNSFTHVTTIEDFLQIPRKPMINASEIPNLILERFVTENSKIFFTNVFNPLLSQVRCDFLYEDPSTWLQNDSYIKCEEIAKTISVVNDLAESQLAAMKTYNGVLTKSELQTQFVLDKLVEQHRKEIPSTATKSQMQRAFENM